jgi:hypothetical protein
VGEAKAGLAKRRAARRRVGCFTGPLTVWDGLGLDETMTYGKVYAAWMAGSGPAMTKRRGVRNRI